MKKSRSIWVRVGTIFAMLGATVSVGASPFFDYTVIARSGEAGIVSIPGIPATNENGKVAVVASLDDTSTLSHKGIFVGDGETLPVNISPELNQVGHFFSPYVQINNNEDPQVVAAWSKFLNPQPSWVDVWNGNAIDANTTIAFSPNQTTGFLFTGFHAINDLGNVAFYRMTNVSTGNSFLSTPLGPSGFNERFFSYPLAIRMTDDGRILTRTGISSFLPVGEFQGELQLLNNDLASGEVIADTNGFVRLGWAGAVTDDGKVVVFSGELNQTGADMINAAQSELTYSTGGELRASPLEPGVGVFYSIETEVGRVIQRLAGELLICTKK